MLIYKMATGNMSTEDSAKFCRAYAELQFKWEKNADVIWRVKYDDKPVLRARLSAEGAPRGPEFGVKPVTMINTGDFVAKLNTNEYPASDGGAYYVFIGTVNGEKGYTRHDNIEKMGEVPPCSPYPAASQEPTAVMSPSSSSDIARVARQVSAGLEHRYKVEEHFKKQKVTIDDLKGWQAIEDFLRYGQGEEVKWRKVNELLEVAKGCVDGVGEGDMAIIYKNIERIVNQTRGGGKKKRKTKKRKKSNKKKSNKKKSSKKRRTKRR